MNIKTKKFILLLILISLFVQLQVVYSNNLNLITFTEAIQISKNETNRIFKINKKTEDECYRFFPLYFSVLSETELKGSFNKDILALVKYNFLSWVNKYNEIQIMNSNGHVLTHLEKSQLVKKLVESDSQSLVITENYVMYNILFNDSNYSGQLFDIFNSCDNSSLYKEQNVEPVYIPENFDDTFEFILSNEIINHTLIGNERELKYQQNNFSGKIIDEYPSSKDLYNSKDDFNNIETRIFKNSKGLMSFFGYETNLRNKTISHKDTEIEEPKKEEFKDVGKSFGKNVTENGEKELIKGGKMVRYIYLPKEKTNLRKKESKKPYKKMKSSHFYLDRRPIVSNQVYVVEN